MKITVQNLKTQKTKETEIKLGTKNWNYRDMILKITKIGDDGTLTIEKQNA